MEFRDYFKRQMDDFSRAMSVLIARVLLLREVNEFTSAYELVRETWLGEPGIDITELLQTPEDEVIPRLLKAGCVPETISEMCNLVMLIANWEHPDNSVGQRIALYRRCLVMIEFVSIRQQQLSLQHYQWQQQIYHWLKQVDAQN